MQRYFFAIFLFLFFSRIKSQILENKIFDDSIKSVYIHLKGDKLSYPVLRLNTNDVLVLEFDDLNMNNKTGDYQYTFIHCNYDWTPSDLYYEDYIEGYDENYVDNYEFSFNTVVNFVHYEIEFPNQNITFLKSGNYIIKIYKDYDTSQCVLQMRFVVVEPKVQIKGTVRLPSIPQYRDKYQEVDFTVSSNQTLDNPLEYVKAVVVQNFDWRFSKVLSPKYLRGNDLVYDYEKENLFPAGNEYLFFSTKNLNFIVPPIEKTEVINKIYHFYLSPLSPIIHYFSANDINGKFYIRNEKGMKDETEADYVYVHFYLNAPVNLKNKIYLYGDLTNRELTDKYKMKYNKITKRFYLELLLKQGVYNFSFYVKDASAPNLITGNFFETENLYFVFIYYYNVSLDYYELIGYQLIKSR